MFWADAMEKCKYRACCETQTEGGTGALRPSFFSSPLMKIIFSSLHILLFDPHLSGTTAVLLTFEKVDHYTAFDLQPAWTGTTTTA